MRIVIFAAVCALPLAGCNQQQTAQLQQAASAAIGEAHQGLDAASAALGAAKQAVDSAAALNPEWKQQLDQLKQQASAAKGALKPSP